MLTHLSIHNIVLIKQLSLAFDTGLTVLTGETGAGKSILLSALGLVMGDRADSGLIRAGEEAASVSAQFALAKDSPVIALLNEQAIACEDELIIRRQLMRNGSGKIWMNDTPVTLKLLRQVAGQLVVIHGQHGQKGLMDSAYHAQLLDSFGGLQPDADEVASHYQTYKRAKEALAELIEENERSLREKDYLSHIVKELEALHPVPGEETELVEQRAAQMQAEKHGKLLTSLEEQLNGAQPVAGILSQVQQTMIRQGLSESGSGKHAVESLERALFELSEAEGAIAQMQRGDAYDEQALENAEERLFTLREQARKHRVSVDELADIFTQAREKLVALEQNHEDQARLMQDVSKARDAYCHAAKQLTEKRRNCAATLQTAMHRELAPLKMEATQFRVAFTPLDEQAWQRSGTEAVAFEVSTNPGSPFAPLHAIASGGELSRFMLAMAVVIRHEGNQPSLMVFDEIDTGTGGAVAEAIGVRLAMLSRHHQVAVVTHLPQVAAQGDTHFLIEKQVDAEQTSTKVTRLDDAARLEEMARMLAGADVSAEARKAADKLLKGRYNHAA